MTRLSSFFSISAAVFCFLCGCSGGTMGTGVRTYSPSPEMPERESSIFDIKDHTLSCTLDHGERSVHIALGPVKLAGSSSLHGTDRCQAKFLPLSRTLRALVTLNDEALVDAPYELQVRDSQGSTPWRTLYRSTTTQVSEQSDFALALLPDVSLRAEHEYRLVITPPEGEGDEAILEFELGESKDNENLINRIFK